MAGIIETSVDVVLHSHATTIFYSSEVQYNRLCIFGSVKRQFWVRTTALFTLMTLRLIGGVFLLQVCSIKKYDLGDFSCLRAVYLAR